MFVDNSHAHMCISDRYAYVLSLGEFRGDLHCQKVIGKKACQSFLLIEGLAKVLFGLFIRPYMAFAWAAKRHLRPISCRRIL